MLDWAHRDNGMTYKLDELFYTVDCTDKVMDMLPSISDRLLTQKAVMRADSIDAAVGRQCGKPWTCPFFSTCHKPLPKDHVLKLPRVSQKQLDNLYEDGICRVTIFLSYVRIRLLTRMFSMPWYMYRYKISQATTQASQQINTLYEIPLRPKLSKLMIDLRRT